MKPGRQQCFLHPDRGAVARCPECKRFYCHECITEHAGEVLCRRCLNREVEEEISGKGFFSRNRAVVLLLLKPLFAMMGFIVLWFFFVALGSMLMNFPDTFYDSAPVPRREGR